MQDFGKPELLFGFPVDAHLLVKYCSPPKYILVCHISSSFPFIGRGTDGANVASVRISAWWMKDGMQTLRVQTSVVVRMLKKEVITLTCNILFPNLL